MWFSEWLRVDPNCLHYWPFGSLTRKRQSWGHTTRKEKKNRRKRESSFWLSWQGKYCWILRASEWLSSVFQYNNLQQRGGGSISQMRTPVPYERFFAKSTIINDKLSLSFSFRDIYEPRPWDFFLFYAAPKKKKLSNPILIWWDAEEAGQY